MCQAISEINKVIKVGQTYGFDARHGRQVGRLASRLFDELRPLHGKADLLRECFAREVLIQIEAAQP